MGQYDTSYKNLFSHPQMVQELLQSFVKESWVNLIDFSTLEKCNNSYVTDDLRERIDDVIWKVRWQGKELYLYILLELQSNVDFFMSVRMMTYIGLLYQDLIKSNNLKKNDLLPPVLPIVLYNGSKKWSASHNIQNLIQKAPRGFTKFIPKIEYFLIDETQTTHSELSEHNNCVSALFKLEKCRTPEAMLEVVQNLLVWLKSSEQDSLRRAFTVWIARVIMPAKFKDNKVPDINSLEEVNTMLAETVKQWPIKWMNEGKKEEKIETANNMLIRNFDIKIISEVTGLSIEQIKALKTKAVSDKSAKYSAKKKKLIK